MTTGWQPIETAPKDHSHVLLFEPGERMGSLLETPDVMWIGFWKREGFVRQEDDHIYINATHWHPLPAPPHGS